MITKKVERAVDLYNNGFLCSQAIFTTFCEELGVDFETGLRLSRFLGAGLMYRAEMCGALSGAMMVYGLKFNSGSVKNELGDEIFHNLSKEHLEKFASLHGSCMCKDLMEHDLSTPEGLEILRKSGAFKSKCPKFVRDSAEILANSLEKMKERGY